MIKKNKKNFLKEKNGFNNSDNINVMLIYRVMYITRTTVVDILRRVFFFISVQGTSGN